jgi:hypothetical protein
MQNDKIALVIRLQNKLIKNKYYEKNIKHIKFK